MERLFRSTMSGLETGLRVAQIATFKLICCSADEDAGDVLKDPARCEFDQIPVRYKSRIMGVLEREKLFRGSVRDSMRLLDDSLLVACRAESVTAVPNQKRV